MTGERRCRYTFSLDEETSVALRRLAQAEDRSQAAQLRILIRSAAQSRGVWTPKPLLGVVVTPTR